MIVGLLAKLLASPFVVRVIVPALRDAVARFLHEQAAALELRGAVKQAKAAKSAEELRVASKRLTDAANRR